MDDNLYIPTVDQVMGIIDGVGLLLVGDSTMSALQTRAPIVHVRQRYLCPTAMLRQDDAITTRKKTLGWRAYVTDAPAELLTLAQAVLSYRAEWLIERGFHRLKGVPLPLNPLFVKHDDQVVGLTNLLSITVHMLTVVEFVVRRKLKQYQDKLVGLIENNPNKGIDNPTTERLLKQFVDITSPLSICLTKPSGI